MKKHSQQKRINLDGEFDKFGRLFICPVSAVITDLSPVRILRCAVDTVRQLYRGRLDHAVLTIFENPGIITFAGESWVASRVGRDSGYQYKLQNADLGLIALVKNHNKKIDQVGPHLKFEVSPHLIDSMPPDQLQARLDHLAGLLLDDLEHNQCAVHLALDIQCWTPPADLVSRMHCRARSQREFSGVERIEFDERSAVYGRGKSFLFGSAAGLQLAIYNKTDQARATDKLDYWQAVWRQTDNPMDPLDSLNYDPAMPVWRIELRFHHSIVEQFSQGSHCTTTGTIINTSTFAQIAPHLDGLWRYGLTAFKLLTTYGTYDAFWTLIAEDVTVTTCADNLSDQVNYRRHYKTAGGFSGKNVELFMGNFVSLLARERIGAKKALGRLKEWECWPVILEHFEGKGKTERDIYYWLRDKLTERTLRYGVAI